MQKTKLWVSPVEAVLYIMLILVIIGTVNIFSASFVMAGQLLDDSYFFLKRHLISFGLGFAGLLAAVRLDYHKLRRLLLPMTVVTIALLIAVKFIGIEANGAKRWLNLGIQFQPSELAKLMSLILTASYLGPKIDRNRRITLMSMPILIIGITGFMVLRQPDMGTASIIVGLCVILYIIAGLPRSQLYLLCALCAAGAVYLTYAAAYRAERISAWINPWAFQDSTGYQTVQSLLAIGSGGFFGAGLGMGASKFYYLPEAHTDFAFAVLCQEMGFAGALVVLLLLGALACYGGQIARQAQDGFGKMLAVGVTILVAGQGLANIAMVSGLLPVIGVPLPFLSFGGTSLIVNMVSIGILMSVGRKAGQGLPPEPRRTSGRTAEGRRRLRVLRPGGSISG
ncbi:cell division protein FtsW|uniref:Probable peptidoglycan glycosyltransferase FtsW n=1 Tax=Dendrosporobacter quercicolus TaxID=146817 RepID=A0A1G9Z801_9FIRM|nr:putative peptidoglycan glycosyltransferase FtsW [Dendrosporobacter quercicolus]NSL49000.1 cell division protein FtsW [Dendrosporobacter quercicolus DSM 1736]SDN17257.1 cell division protein FtsW [Dendrosporobacter quercicolus]